MSMELNEKSISLTKTEDYENGNKSRARQADGERKHLGRDELQ